MRAPGTADSLINHRGRWWGGGSPQQHIAQQNCRVEDFVKGADTHRDIKVNVFTFLDVFLGTCISSWWWQLNSTGGSRISRDETFTFGQCCYFVPRWNLRNIFTDASKEISEPQLIFSLRCKMYCGSLLITFGCAATHTVTLSMNCSLGWLITDERVQNPLDRRLILACLYMSPPL